MTLPQDYLRQKYLVEQLSLREVAADAGVAPGTVRYYMRKYRIPRRTQSEALSGDKNPMHGKAHTEDAKKRIVETLRQTNLDPEVIARRRACNQGVNNPMYGRTHTDEVKEASRQRLAETRNTPAFEQAHCEAMARPEVREALSQAASSRTGERNSFHGKTHTAETKAKISKANMGRFRGENGSNWQGGITPLRLAIRGCTKALAWRKAVFERDDYTCVLCGKRGGELNADHVVPFSKILRDAGVTTLEQAEALDALWDLANGRTLCVPCHKATDTYCGRASQVP